MDATRTLPSHEITPQYVRFSDPFSHTSLIPSRQISAAREKGIKARKLEAQKRFITTYTEYEYAVIDEASDSSDRANGRVRGVEDYLNSLLADTHLFRSPKQA